MWLKLVVGHADDEEDLRLTRRAARWMEFDAVAGRFRSNAASSCPTSTPISNVVLPLSTLTRFASNSSCT